MGNHFPKYIGPRPRSFLLIVTGLDPPHLHAYALGGFVPPLRWLAHAAHADWRFAARHEGTHVVWRYRFALTSALAWPVAWPILRLFMQRAMRRCLDAMAASVGPTAGKSF
jgi:hypothetical protein